MNIKLLVFIGLFSVVIWGTGCQETKPDLTIAVAANLQFVMEKIITRYEKETGQSIEMVTGSSGKLFLQITNGAPFDVFLSADTLYPNRVIRNGGTESNYKIFAHGVLVFWSADTLNEIPGLLLPHLAQRWKNNTKKWAIANPRTAPYGFATQKYLEGMQVYNKLLPFQVQGESVAQVNQFVHTHSVSFGFTSLSSVIAKNIDPAFWYTIDPDKYPLIQQTALELKPSKKSKGFIEYLESPETIECLAEQGYLIPKS